MAQRGVTANRLADLVVFYVGYRMFGIWASTSDNLDADTQAAASQHLAIADKLLKRFGAQMTEGLTTNAETITTKFPSFKASFKQALRSGAPTTMAGKQSEFLVDFLPRLRSRSQVLREMFEGRSEKVIKAVAGAAEVGGVEALNKCATITPVSGVRLFHKWLGRAAEIAGVPVTDLESVAADVSAAQEMGQELGRVKNSIDNLDPTSTRAVELEYRRQEIEVKISTIVETSRNPQAVEAAAATALADTYQHQTEIGQRLGHTADQEEAMMATGRTIIAAGAGSGKTRVLASKVAWHISEGVPASSILATSFTRKSSAELVRRVEEYGAVIPENARDGFGTTHSIAGKMLNRSARQYRRPNGYIGKSEGWKQVSLLRLAMQQVGMPGGGPAPEPVGFWDGAGVPDSATVDPGYIPAIESSIGYFSWIYDKPWGSRGRWRKTPEYLRFLRAMKSKVPSTLTQKEKNLLNEIFALAKDYGRPLSYRIAAKKKEDSGGAEDVEGTTKRQKHPKMKDYVYWETPAGQWFNLGNKLVDENGKPLPLGGFKNYISIVKGKGISPSQAWHDGIDGRDPNSDYAAVYAAYEWLKGSSGEPTFQNLGDMDDILIDTVTALVASPRLRAQIQGRYKVILVDEAQDLNRVQHLLFGLMAGNTDPMSLEPVAGNMTADTFALIGDDKQAIYEFRGADPDEFIDKSDLTEGGESFTTHLLKINFRSGEQIVGAANRLIAHNKKQIPMVCEANVDVKGQGAIVQRRAPTTEGAALAVAEEIEAMMEEGLVPTHDKKKGRGGYASFGVALRSNAEAYSYGLELLKKGIPFKSNARFFNDPNSKALIAWLTLAENGLTGNVTLVNEALPDALLAPLSGISARTLSDKLAGVQGSWAEWIQDPANQRAVYYRKDMRERLTIFAENVALVATFSGEPQEVLGQIMTLRGLDGSTVKDSLIDNVRRNGDVMAELAAAADNGIPTQEQVEEMAMAPVQPLLSLMRDKADIAEAMGFVRKLQKVNERITSKDDEEEMDRDAVTIGTMHSWKGLEVPNLYVPMVGGRFPRSGPDGIAPEGPDLWSERRLAYVAITRAEDRCVILNIPNPKFGTTSQFISEACVSYEGVEPQDDPGAVKMAAEGYDIDDLLSNISLLRGGPPSPGEEEGMAPGLEDLWGETLEMP